MNSETLEMTLSDYEDEVMGVYVNLDDINNILCILWGYLEQDENAFEKNPDERTLFVCRYPRIRTLISVMIDITSKSKKDLESLTKVDITRLK